MKRKDEVKLRNLEKRMNGRNYENPKVKNYIRSNFFIK